MKMKYRISVIVALLTGNMQGVVIDADYSKGREIMDGHVNLIQGMSTLEYLNKSPCWDVVATSTNLVLKPNPAKPRFMVCDRSKINEDSRMKLELPRDMYYDPSYGFTFRRAESYIGNNEDVILTPDREIVIEASTGDGYLPIIFTPVSFKNRLKGFRVTENAGWMWLVYDNDGNVGVTNVGTHVSKYVALSDTPTDMTEDDVETIMEWTANEDGYYRGEWKTYERGGKSGMGGEGVVDTAPPTETPPAVAPEEPPTREPPAPVVVDGGEGNGRHPRRWHYAILPLALCLCGIVYFARRKK